MDNQIEGITNSTIKEEPSIITSKKVRKKRNYTFFWIAFVLVVMIVILYFTLSDSSTINDDTYFKIDIGMTRNQVEEIFNSKGEYDRSGRFGILDAETGNPVTLYRFSENKKTTVMIFFEEDIVVKKKIFKSK